MELILTLLIGCVFGENISFISDPGVYGPPLEIAHAYYQQWPTGIAVSSTGRMFSNYPGGLDPSNVYNGRNEVFAVGELTTLTSEVAYPSLEMNRPPGGAINYSTIPPISVMSVMSTTDGVLLEAMYGGPKLVGVNLTTNTVFKTIVFPSTVAYGDSYLNDVRFDLRPNLSDSSGEGFAYITDSSTSGHNALIIVDLGSGESWRHLGLTKSVRGESQFLPFIWGQPGYYTQAKEPYSGLSIGSDGIALSADGETLYWCPLASRYMYSAPTAKLRARGEASELLAQQSVMNNGQKGLSDGLETDSNGLIYVGNNEGNAINMFNPSNGMVLTFLRDPRINWVDTMSVATDGYLYFTVNQLNFAASTYPGIDRRVAPFALFKAKLPNGGSKVSSR
ncbi:MRJP-domain-containing protein [Daldinia vernicosa]|uniref:MRJP-domain-containing protein n=1 Tax=Daldinia vernicosa TaxID=114800 RepID=UPI002008153C|nr:MRJP-domain-containing protein [Daldinia vernicosa]KAI0844051.1 MRJP-domain-containing protein [Daldinia vernicosa]